MYEAWRDGKSIGKGDCEYYATKRFSQIVDIHKACEEIKKDYPFDANVQIQILNYIVLRQEANNVTPSVTTFIH